MKSAKLLFVLAAAAAVTLASCSDTPAYRNPELSPAERTADLLSRMTLEEKLGQLICPLGWPMYEKIGSDSVTVSDEYRRFIESQHGGMLWATFRADPWTRKTLETGLNPTLSAEAYNALQRYAIEHSRLGIPILLAEEAPHGHMAIGTTVFPTGVGMASTWSPETVERAGHAVARQLRAQGAHIGYGPVIDLAREPRWSRVEETFGEDVCLTSEMAAAVLRGTSVKHNGPELGVVSTLKHFVAYGVPEGGHNGNPSIVGERDLWENFLPAFRRAVDEGALSIMTSYNTIDGVPSTSNGRLLSGMLHDEWGFEGFTVSDLESIDGLCNTHRIARDLREAAELAMRAGVDVDLGAHCYPLLAESVREGRFDERLIDRAAGRVLRLKFMLGLFDNPYTDPSEAAARVNTPEDIELAREAAREGVTLLENRNNTLPLGKNIRVAVVGPNADNIYNQLGDYTAPQPEGNIITPLAGIRAKLGEANVIYAKGCAVRDTEHADIAAAVAAARRADAVVAVVGGSSARDFRTKYIDTGAAVVDSESVSDMECGEGFDRSSLELLGLQNELLKALKATGKPLVVVYIEGRPLDKRWAAENADALITQWYPGQEGGSALADVLFGDYNPAGRLPVSVPRDAGQLPVYYNKRFPVGHDYVEMPAAPLYPFGYGLSYTNFEYSAPALEATGDGQWRVSFDLRNAGSRDGDEVAQLYITDEQASTVRPRKQLRAFRRLHLKAGETRRVEFAFGEEALTLYDAQMQPVVEPGEFTLHIGASSEDIRLTQQLTISR